MESNEHYFSVFRYVERNALRASLVQRAEDWRWGSLWRRLQTAEELPQILTDGPLPLPNSWLEEVNLPQTEGELRAIRRCVQRGQPYGRESWVQKMAGALGLECTLRPRGRPRKPVAEVPTQRREAKKGS